MENAWMNHKQATYKHIWNPFCIQSKWIMAAVHAKLCKNKEKRGIKSSNFFSTFIFGCRWHAMSSDHVDCIRPYSLLQRNVCNGHFVVVHVCGWHNNWSTRGHNWILSNCCVYRLEGVRSGVARWGRAPMVLPSHWKHHCDITETDSRCSELRIVSGCHHYHPSDISSESITFGTIRALWNLCGPLNASFWHQRVENECCAHRFNHSLIYRVRDAGFGIREKRELASTWKG